SKRGPLLRFTSCVSSPIGCGGRTNELTAHRARAGALDSFVSKLPRCASHGCPPSRILVRRDVGRLFLAGKQVVFLAPVQAGGAPLAMPNVVPARPEGPGMLVIRVGEIRALDTMKKENPFPALRGRRYAPTASVSRRTDRPASTSSSRRSPQ